MSFDWLGALQEVTVKAVDTRGVQVYLKTDIGPELKIYDSDAPASSGEGLPIKYAVRVTDRQGNQLTGYGEPPATNPIKAAIFAGVILAGVYLALTGLVRISDRVKI